MGRDGWKNEHKCDIMKGIMSEKQTFEFMNEPSWEGLMELPDMQGLAAELAEAAEMDETEVDGAEEGMTKGLVIEPQQKIKPFDVPGFDDETADWGQREKWNLAMEAPELAARFARIAEETGTNFGPLEWQLRGCYAEVAEQVDKHDDTTLVELANMQNVLGEGELLPRGIWQRSGKDIGKLYEHFGEMCAEFVDVEDEGQQEDLKRILKTFADGYDAERTDSEGVREAAVLAKDIVQNEPRRIMPYEVVMTHAMEGRGIGTVVEAWSYLEGLRQSPDNTLLPGLRKSEVASLYFKTHGLTEDEKQGLEEVVFPLIAAQDPEVDVLTRNINSWGMYYGAYGLSDFRCKCLVSKVNPRNVNEMLLAQRELPAGDLARLEQNRRDALAIQGTVINARDFIHDERPGVHELLGAMVDFYDAQGTEKEAEKTAILQQIIAERMSSQDAGYYHGLAEHALKVENYEQPIQDRIWCDGKTEDYDTTAIEVLRRLVANTDQQSLEVPETKDAELNKLMQQVDVWKDTQTGVVQADFQQTGELIKYVNGLLMEAQGNTGIWPSTIEAVAYAERMATLAMRGVDHKNWRELPYDENFKEMVKFRDLTGSAEKFSEEEFESFWRRFAQVPMEEGDRQLREHYAMLQQRIVGKLNVLASEYVKHPGTAHRVGELWSGNLNHELMGLVDG